MARTSYATANGLLAAARALGLEQASFHQLPGARALALLDRVFDSFGQQGRAGRTRWLWNDLREPTLFVAGPHDLDVLLALGPSSTPVWLIAEDFAATKRDTPFWVFEAKLSAAVATLQNHHLLEFYLVSDRSPGSSARTTTVHYLPRGSTRSQCSQGSRARFARGSS